MHGTLCFVYKSALRSQKGLYAIAFTSEETGLTNLPPKSHLTKEQRSGTVN